MQGDVSLGSHRLLWLSMPRGKCILFTTCRKVAECFWRLVAALWIHSLQSSTSSQLLKEPLKVFIELLAASPHQLSSWLRLNKDKLLKLYYLKTSYLIFCWFGIYFHGNRSKNSKPAAEVGYTTALGLFYFHFHGNWCKISANKAKFPFFLINPFLIFHFQINLLPETQTQSHWKRKKEQHRCLHEPVQVFACECVWALHFLTWIFKVISNLLWEC